MSDVNAKPALRRQLRDRLAAMTDADRHAKSVAACLLIANSPEFASASTVMLYLSTPHQVDTAPLALRCWQANTSDGGPEVRWAQRRTRPVECPRLQTAW